MVKYSPSLETAIRLANQAIESWSLEELKQYAFDRLVDEYEAKLRQEESQVRFVGYDANGSPVYED